MQAKNPKHPGRLASLATGKTAPTIVVARKLVKVVRPVAFPRSRSGNISEHTTHAMGPHVAAKPTMYNAENVIIRYPTLFSLSLLLLSPAIDERIVFAIRDTNIKEPPDSNNLTRPYFSIDAMVMNVATKFTAFNIIAA